MNAEQLRLLENEKKSVPLEPWGPYISERQWGTVREDYSQNTDTWGYFPFDHAHQRAYLWGEDGIAGISDYYQNLCFSVAMWNGKDSIIKERLFGLSNPQGNHGEDVKELYFHLDNTPTHYYMEYLYKYPQNEFPYEQLKKENRERNKLQSEYEILDTGIFDQNEYFDVKITYAKHDSRDIGIKISITNRASKAAPITILPLFWFYNRWSYRDTYEIPSIQRIGDHIVKASHHRMTNQYYFYYQPSDDAWFTDNETNTEKLFGKENKSIFLKDAFHEALINQKNVSELRDRGYGTRFTPVYHRNIDGGATVDIYCRLSIHAMPNAFDQHFFENFNQKKQEADAFYNDLLSKTKNSELRTIQRQALSGLLWSKQYYHYDVERWLNQSDKITPITDARIHGRNSSWLHLKNQNIVSMPDKWEYPWYAAWDLSYQCVAYAAIDPSFAKNQLLLLMREWYMKPDGQFPSYEWNFDDVNPPVQAWAVMEVYEIEKQAKGKGDIDFLKRAFQKLLINFTWWINRKDPNGNNLFEGGFLGLDNIGVFNRSMHNQGDTKLEQADGTSWMGIYALDMMDIALEISNHDNAFEDSVTKFFEHFVMIAEALNEHILWNEEDKFFYDVLCKKDAAPEPLRIQSIVGLTSLYAVSIISEEIFDKLPDLKKRYNWFKNYRIKNNRFWPNELHSSDKTILLSLVKKDRLESLLTKLLDETEFLSKGGIRALSKYHKDHPYSVTIDGVVHSIQYDPGDSTSDMFGGNSNWRGPIWMPINFIIIQAIGRFGKFYGNDLMVEYPTGSGKKMNLKDISNELSKRVISLFQRDATDQVPAHGEYNYFFQRPENRDLHLFYEYFHGDTGKGLGASHQTGWTALVAEMIREVNG